MEFGDSGELYNVTIEFYSGQYSKVLEHSLDEFSPEHQTKLLEYQVRSSVSLKKDASKLIDDGKSQFEDDSLFHLLSAWNDLHSFGVDDSTYFEDVKLPEFELQAILTAIYTVKYLKDLDGAISLMIKYIDNSTMLKINELEPLMILIQLYLVKGDFNAANKIFNNFKNFPDSARDSIVYQILESWILSISGETDNINNSFFFYDEALSRDFEADEYGKFKLLNVLFVLRIKLKQFPEATELLKQIKSFNIKNDDFIANQITLNYLIGKSENNSELIEELTNVNPEHGYIAEHKSKNELFDQVVLKYKA